MSNHAHDLQLQTCKTFISLRYFMIDFKQSMSQYGIFRWIQQAGSEEFGREL